MQQAGTDPWCDAITARLEHVAPTLHPNRLHDPSRRIRENPYPPRMLVQANHCNVTTVTSTRTAAPMRRHTPSGAQPDFLTRFQHKRDRPLDPAIGWLKKPPATTAGHHVNLDIHQCKAASSSSISIPSTPMLAATRARNNTTHRRTTLKTRSDHAIAQEIGQLIRLFT